MKIGFISGHSDLKAGASGNGYQEHLVVRDIANECIRYARETYEGTFMIDNNNQHSGGGEEDFIIKNKLDYFMSIHLNSATASANGSEIIVNCREKTTGIEDKILSRLNKEIGFKNRGVKRRKAGGEWITGTQNVDDYYGILRQPMKNGIHGSIIEICFVSNTDDMKKLMTNKDKIVKIIVDSICEGFGLKKKASTNTPIETPVETPIATQTKLYRTVIFTGSYENAVKMKNEAMLKGFNDAFIIEK